MATSVTHEPDVLEREVNPTLPASMSAGVDVQVATAKRFPRSIEAFVRRCKEMATLDAEVAGSCVYALPRDGKTIEGPSARLAEIVASAWGNMRIQAGATDSDERYITARGEAWDVETNVAIGFEVRRRITNRQGKTFNDDMITVTGNAAASIALRNAVFKAVPSAFWKPIYNECRKVIAGDVRTFHARRDDTLKAFMVMGVTPDRLLASLGLKGVLDLTLDHMVTLTGIFNALKDGETTIEEAFPDAAGPIRPAARVSQQAAAPETAAAVAAPEQPATAPAGAPAYIGVVTDVDQRSAAVAVATLSTGYRAVAKTAEFIAALKGHKASSAIVELTCAPSSDQSKYLPVIESMAVVGADA